MTRPDPRTAGLVRKERPEDLHPIIRDVYDAFLSSGMSVVDISHEINAKRGTIYRWLQGLGRPDIRELDKFLAVFGWRFAVVNDTRRETVAIRQQVAGLDRTYKNQVDPPPPSVHPLIREVFDVWQPSGVDMAHAAALAGISRGTIYRWLDGDGTPTVEGIEAFLNVFGKRLKVTRGTRHRDVVQAMS